jgi:hypothetical protein
MVNALFTQPERLNIAIPVEHGKGFAVFEHGHTVVGEGGSCQDIELIGDADNVFQRNLLISWLPIRCRYQRAAGQWPDAPEPYTRR